jgi:hypothetical protein
MEVILILLITPRILLLILQKSKGDIYIFFPKFLKTHQVLRSNNNHKIKKLKYITTKKILMQA